MLAQCPLSITASTPTIAQPPSIGGFDVSCKEMPMLADIKE